MVAVVEGRASGLLERCNPLSSFVPSALCVRNQGASCIFFHSELSATSLKLQIAIRSRLMG